MSEQTLLRMEGIDKSFGVVQALVGVNFDLKAGEIHGLVGGNGAGKTTLMNVLYGLYKPDGGTIVLRGQPVQVTSPRDAIRHGIGMVHQHFLQINTFSVIENIVLGASLPNRPTMDLRAARERTRSLSQHFGLQVSLDARIEELAMGVRQRVEILKALYRGVEVLILDEPTTNLTPQEVDSLFQSLEMMVAEGMSVVFITHKLREVMAVCQRVSVMRDGRLMLTSAINDVNEETIVRNMVGDEVELAESLLFAEDSPVIQGPVDDRKVFEIEGLTIAGDGVPEIEDVTLSLRMGEILGLAGVAGNGQRALLEGILGILPRVVGQVRLNDISLTKLTTSQIFAQGVAYVPEDRLQDGFLPTASVAQNLMLGDQRQAPYSNQRGILRWDEIYRAAARLIETFSIRTQNPRDRAANLSGGNIQRLMLARALSRPTTLLLAHNPTSGLDIPAVEFIYSLLTERRQEGMATLLVSDDLDELLLLSDRIAVIYKGKIVGILKRREFDRYEIGRMMSGAKRSD